MEAGAVPRVGHPVGMPTLSPRFLRLASDARLVGLIREGRHGAFETIYDRHHRGILAFCRHMLGDADEAEDAVQHTFMAAYSDMLASDKPLHLRAWLYTVARNRCYSILRARREHPSAELEEVAGEGLASQVQRRQDLRDLVSDMRELPVEQRAALVLAELDALSHAEIAEVLDVPREKVKALVYQARESLVASRAARDTACADIREQLACGRGAALRRANLRRHLRECDGCRAFRAEVEHQRKQFAVLLPVLPSLALKQGILGTTAGTSATTAVGGGVIASSAIKTGIAKGLIGALLAGVGTAGTIVVATTDVHIQSLLSVISGSAGRTQPHGGRSDALLSRAGGTSAPGARSRTGATDVVRFGSAAPTRAAGRPAVGNATDATRPSGARVSHHRSGAGSVDHLSPVTGASPSPAPTPTTAAPSTTASATGTISGYGTGTTTAGGGERGSGSTTATGAAGRSAGSGGTRTSDGTAATVSSGSGSRTGGSSDPGTGGTSSGGTRGGSSGSTGTGSSGSAGGSSGGVRGVGGAGSTGTGSTGGSSGSTGSTGSSGATGGSGGSGGTGGTGGSSGGPGRTLGGGSSGSSSGAGSGVGTGSGSGTASGSGAGSASGSGSGTGSGVGNGGGSGAGGTSTSPATTVTDPTATTDVTDPTSATDSSDGTAVTTAVSAG